MKTAIITDTNSGITIYITEKLGIYVIPMSNPGALRKKPKKK